MYGGNIPNNQKTKHFSLLATLLSISNQVSTTDSDSGINQKVSYSLNYPEFAVNSSGFVYTTRSLDRELVAEYDIKVVATDHGTPSKVDMKAERPNYRLSFSPLLTFHYNDKNSVGFSMNTPCGRKP